MFAYAGAKDAEYSYQPKARIIMVEYTKMIKQIGVNYIRLIYVNKAIPNVLNISMASNYYNGDTDTSSMTYSSITKSYESTEVYS